jgi:hypothetical protein
LFALVQTILASLTANFNPTDFVKNLSPDITTLAVLVNNGYFIRLIAEETFAFTAFNHFGHIHLTCPL